MGACVRNLRMDVGGCVVCRMGGGLNKHVTIIDKPPRINTGTLVQKLRRIRTELGLMLQQVDDALERIEKP